MYCPPSLRVIVSAFLLCQNRMTAEGYKFKNSRQVKQNMAKGVFSHAFAQSTANRDHAVATFGKAYKKATSKDTDPYGLLRAALRWGWPPSQRAINPKAPSQQDLRVLSRGLFCFPALSRLRGAVALFAAWVCVYPPEAQRGCCNSPTAAREGLALLACVQLFRKAMCPAPERTR